MPQFMDLGRVDGLYLVPLMEQASSTWQDVIIRKLSYNDALAMGRIAAMALTNLNAAGLIHQDVKPANYLVDSDNCPMPADFGAAFSKEHWHLVKALVHEQLASSAERRICSSSSCVACIHPYVP